jgi:hypothetical protein
MFEISALSFFVGPAVVAILFEEHADRPETVFRLDRALSSDIPAIPEPPFPAWLKPEGGKTEGADTGSARKEAKVAGIP